MRNEPQVQSVDRAVQVLQLVGERGAMGVSELSRALGVHKTTASRLAATLAYRGLLERDQGERYRLGLGLVYLAGEVMSDLDVVTVSRPIVQQLAETTHETVNIGVLHAGAVVCVDQATGASGVMSVSWIGRRTPLNCTSNGKVLLAGMEQAQLARILAAPLEGCTRRSIVEPAALRAELERCRQRGYASTVEELEDGLNAVAAPIFRGDGRVAAALSIAGPAFRVRPLDLPRLGAEAIAGAEVISRRLGYRARADAGRKPSAS